ncbi:MAG: hypothetical protein HY832_00225 [Candidatus Aenigmarchaeota archaeon]|nr:hypothetical protein [Candidatus Aenigmarchaeota archaeon]
MIDIGEFIFVTILKMTQYPSAPFSGEIVSDLVMFLFVPSIFIILIIYQILNRLFESGPRKFKFLFGVGFYLVIIFQGFYAVFAYFAGPYFIFLIFVYGLFFYLIEHFPIARREDEIIEVRQREKGKQSVMFPFNERREMLEKELIICKEEIANIKATGRGNDHGELANAIRRQQQIEKALKRPFG